MGPEELLTEEETLKRLKVNKAQLENYVREGKLSPLYQESVRKFKLSEVSEIMGGTTPEPEPIPETPPPSKVEPPSIKPPPNEGSTRVIEPPKEGIKIGLNKRGVEEREEFLRPLDKVASTTGGKWILILLSVAFAFSAFSVFVLTYNFKGKELPQINKLFSTLGSITIGREEGEELESETNSIIQAAQQTKKDAEALIKETEEFIKE